MPDSEADPRPSQISRFLSENQRAAALTLAEAVAADGVVGNDLRALSKILQEVGEIATSARMLDRLAVVEPPDAAALSALAQMQWIAGRSDDAIATLRRCLIQSPQFYGVFSHLGMIQLSAGRPLDAFMAYATTLSLKPDDPVATLGRACSFRLLNRQNIISVAKGDVQARFALSGRAVTVDFVHLTGVFYEEEELGFVASLMMPGGIIVDVGANIGNHAVFFLRALAPRAMHLFEPNPACLEVLQENLALNLTTDCHVSTYSVGVGAQPGELYLRPHDDLNNGLMPTGVPGARRIEIVTLDAKIPRADLVKIDVEGMELEVLRGAERLLRESRPLLLVEVQTPNLGTFETLLAKHGYRTLWARSHGDFSNIVAGP